MLQVKIIDEICVMGESNAYELKKYFDAKSSFSISELDEKYFINMNRKIKIDILSKIQLDIDER